MTKKPQSDPAPENPYFTMGRWNGLPQWKCTQCPWDTLDGEATLMEHYAERHAPPPEPAKPTIIQTFDRWGNEVKPGGE
jgi:hypothetical protein